jgi:hypothetical protein
MSDWREGGGGRRGRQGRISPHRVEVGAPMYPQPTYGTNGLAIASMILGILWIYWIGSILALIFGYVARSQIRTRHEGGDGMAVAGIVLGWVGVGFLVLTFLLVAGH